MTTPATEFWSPSTSIAIGLARGECSLVGFLAQAGAQLPGRPWPRRKHTNATPRFAVSKPQRATQVYLTLRMLGRGSGGAANPRVSPTSVARLTAHPAYPTHPARPETGPSRQPTPRLCHRAAPPQKSDPGAISGWTERNGASGVEAEAPCTAVESTRLPSGIVSRPGAPVKSEQPFTEPPFIFFKTEDPAFCPLMLGAP